MTSQHYAVASSREHHGMNPTILPSAMGKIVGQTGLFNLGMATCLGEGKLCLKIDLVSHPVCMEELSQ